LARFILSAAVGIAFLSNPATAGWAGVAFSVTCGEAPCLVPAPTDAVAGIPATEPVAGIPVTETA
jgi:hypothetical protein